MSVPDQIEVADKTLTLNGVGVQKKFVFDIYAVALWLENPTTEPAHAAKSEQVKRIQLRLFFGASKRQVADALRDGFRRSNRDIGKVQDRLEKLLAAIPDLSKGDSFTITYRPGVGTTIASARGGELTLPGADFGEAMFNVWLGSDPGTARIRKELTQGA